MTSTAYMKRSIADVYACRKDFYTANRSVVEKFAAGYLKGCEELLDLKIKAAKPYKDILKMTQDIYGKKDIESDLAADGLISDALFVGLDGNVVFFEDKTNTSGFDSRQKAALDTAYDIKSIRQKKDFLKPEFKYASIKEIGGLSGENNLAKINRPPVKPVEAVGDEIFGFTIHFDTDQKTFPEEKYGDNFKDAILQASLFGNAAMEVRGSADLSNVIIQFIKAGLDNGWLKRTGSGGNYEYFINGKKVDLSNVKVLIEELGKQDFKGIDEDQDPRQTMKKLKALSQDRADEVKKSVLNYAKSKGMQVVESQLKVKAMGIEAPAISWPKTEEDRAKNRRVVFQVSKIPVEKVQSAFDY